jgi:hypothetical protein
VLDDAGERKLPELARATPDATERGTDRVKMLREAFLAHQPELDPARTFFIHEKGSTTAMAREVARSPRGERVHDEVPRNYGE